MHVHISFELLILYLKGSLVGLPRLRNLVNVYTSSSKRNNSIYTKLPDRFFSLCRSVNSQIFFLKKKLSANTRNWLVGCCDDCNIRRLDHY